MTFFLPYIFLQSDWLVEVRFEGKEKRYDLEQKMVGFRINGTVENQSDCKDRQ